MKFPVKEILNLPDMKVLDCQEIEGIGIVMCLSFSEFLLFALENFILSWLILFHLQGHKRNYVNQN